MQPTQKGRPSVRSDIPTDRAPEPSPGAKVEGRPSDPEGGCWCDSEAPTGVAATRPVLPRPPRSPNV